ncbi:MAG: HPr kinase/phosphorylase [Lysobacteraceae bacterium]|nr:MAG: HPr kinase/phosphorylase [Xanthomonadaceae bacterium]
MKQSISAGDLFEQVQARLELTWTTGKTGSAREITAGELQHARPSSVGYLNMIHPNNVQVLGREELDYLDALDARLRWETIAQIFAQRPTALVISDGLMPTDDLLESAAESATAIWSSPRPGYDLVSYLQHHIGRALAQRVSLHGVFMEVSSIGVLITGDAGAGKSELALELVTRGHRLIADDSAEMTLIAPDVIDGTCPELLQDCLEVRGLGVLNVRVMFGDDAVKNNKYLRLIIHLQLTTDPSEIVHDRLHGETSTREVLGVQVPTITIPVAPGRNMAVIVEAAVRNQILKMKGYDAARAFINRHESHMRAAEEW